MQQPSLMNHMMASFPTANITTEQIQKYLDENKKLILAILENQNEGRLADCAPFQAQLQKNLMYLAAIADAQPQAGSLSPQLVPHASFPQGAFYTQHPHGATTTHHQPSVFPPKTPLLFGNPHQAQDSHLLQPQSLIMETRPFVAANHNSMHFPYEAATGSSGPSIGPGSSDLRAGSKHDGSDSGTIAVDAPVSSAVEHNSDDGSDDVK